MAVSRWIILGMENFLGKSCTENQNTNFMFNNFFPENGARYEVRRKICQNRQGHMKI